MTMNDTSAGSARGLLPKGYHHPVSLLLAFALAQDIGSLKESFPKLFLPFMLEKDIASERDLEDALRRRLGVRLEVGEAYFFPGVAREGSRTRGVLLIDRLLCRCRGQRAYLPTTGLVADGGRIRVVPEEESRRFWREKIGGP
jgi:hypothetical protein